MTNYSFSYRGVDASTLLGFSVSYSDDDRQDVLITTPDVADGVNVMEGEQGNTFLLSKLYIDSVWAPEEDGVVELADVILDDFGFSGLHAAFHTYAFSTGEPGVGFKVSFTEDADEDGKSDLIIGNRGDGPGPFQPGGSFLLSSSNLLNADAADGTPDGIISLAGIHEYGIPVEPDVVDETPPDLSAIELVADADSGTSQEDDLTNIKTPTISFTAEEGATIEIDWGDGEGPVAVASGNGGVQSYTLDAEYASDGPKTISVVATDAAENKTTQTLEVTIDTNVNAPVISTISEDTGNPEDNITKDNTLTVSGTAEAGSKVTVYIGDDVVGTATAGDDESWTADLTPLAQPEPEVRNDEEAEDQEPAQQKPFADDTYTITAVATDVAGNESGFADSVQVTIDTKAPEVPSISAVSDSNGTVADDGVTGDTTLTVSGTAEEGAKVVVYAGVEIVGSATADADNKWSIEYTGAHGSQVLTATATDKAGNTSDASGDYTVGIDTKPPAAPSQLTISDDAGNPVEGITNDNTLTVSGTAEAGSKVTIFVDLDVAGTATADENGNWTANLTPLAQPEPEVRNDEEAEDQDPAQQKPFADDTYTITAAATDAAGNSSKLAESIQVTIDTDAPGIPSILTVSDSKGTVADDGVTGDTTLTVSGTAEEGAKVVVYAGVEIVGSATADANNKWSIEYTGAHGSQVLTATATDKAGNTSDASGDYTVGIDIKPPEVPSQLTISEDTGVSSEDSITKDNTLTVSGKAEAGSKVTIYIDEIVVGTATADDDDNWTADLTPPAQPEATEKTAEDQDSVPEKPFADDTYTITAVATDAAGNTSGYAEPLKVTVDTTVKAPVVSSISKDTGVSSEDGITKDNTVVFKGTAEENASVEVYLGGESIGVTEANGDGNWKLDYQDAELGDNEYSVTAVATDVAGNESKASEPFTLTVDTAPPEVPVISSISDDSGIPDDGITNDKKLTVNGTADIGSLVTVYVNDEIVGIAETGTDGKWSSELETSLKNGDYSITAVASDAAGNKSEASKTFEVTVDAKKPDAPTKLTISEDTGNPEDNITKDNTLTVSGKAEIGSQVTVYIGEDVVGTATADGKGKWTADLNPPAQPEPEVKNDQGAEGQEPAQQVPFEDGKYKITATATDVAGNTSDLTKPLKVIVDTKIEAPTNLSVVEDTGASSEDGITKDTTLKVKGIAEAGASVEVFLNNSSIGKATANDKGVWKFDHTGTELADGDYFVTAVATDVAGNVSGSSETFKLTVDTAVKAPAITSISEDNGASSEDGVTNDKTLTVNGTAEAGSTVYVYVGESVAGTTEAGNDGSWSTVLENPLADGEHTLRAVAIDPAGNDSVLSEKFVVTIDTEVPVGTTVTSVTDDNGTSTEAVVTNDTTISIDGTAEAHATVEIFLKDTAGIEKAGGKSLGTVTADDKGNWSFDHTETSLADGVYGITAIASDLAGNKSEESDAFSLTVDTVAPNGPVVSSISEDSGAAGDGVTNDNEVTFKGTAEANASVEVFLGSTIGEEKTAAESLGTVKADNKGNWSFDHSETSLADGGYSITAIATDKAGNSSQTSEAFGLTVDTDAPDAPVIKSISDDSGTAGDGVTNDNTPNINGTAEAGATVKVYVGDSLHATVKADDKGNWSTNLKEPLVVVQPAGLVLAKLPDAEMPKQQPLADGVYTVTAVATDLAGNSSDTSEGFSLTVDTVAPVAPVIAFVSDDSGAPEDGVTNDNTLTANGKAEAGSTVKVYVGDSLVGSATADIDGLWSTVLEGLPEEDPLPVAPETKVQADVPAEQQPFADGVYAFTATATDKAGNISVASEPYNVTVDTVAPDAPVVSSVSEDSGSPEDGVTNDNTVTVNGTAEAGSLVEVYVDETLYATVEADDKGAWTAALNGPVKVLQPETSKLQKTDAPEQLPLEDGVYSITAVATDLAGNTSETSEAFNLTVDTTAPGDVVLDDNKILENSAAGTVVGNVSAEDANPLEYTLTGNADGLFALDDGALVVAQSDATLDFETATSHQVTVTATDAAGNETATDLTIEVQNVSEGSSGGSSSGNDDTPILPIDNEVEVPQNVNFIEGSDQNDVISAVHLFLTNLNKTFLGKDGNDTIEGGDNAELIWAGADDDSVSGGVGDDTIGGGTGSDTLNGGDGDDIIYGNTGADFAFGNAGSDNIWTGSDDDTVGGGDDNDQVGAGDGNDEIFGGAGNDKAFGGDGVDTLYGGADNDTLYGGAGNDKLYGGTGDDTLYGGEGDDTYVFESGFGNDGIYGFASNGDNTLDLSGLGLSGTDALSFLQQGDDLVINTGSGTITLYGTTQDDLGTGDILF